MSSELSARNGRRLDARVPPSFLGPSMRLSGLVRPYFEGTANEAARRVVSRTMRLGTYMAYDDKCVWKLQLEFIG
jgi:hypothetical protein